MKNTVESRFIAILNVFHSNKKKIYDISRKSWLPSGVKDYFNTGDGTLEKSRETSQVDDAFSRVEFLDRPNQCVSPLHIASTERNVLFTMVTTNELTTFRSFSFLIHLPESGRAFVHLSTYPRIAWVPETLYTTVVLCKCKYTLGL